MKKLTVAAAFALTVASPALSQECQTGFTVDRIDFIEQQAVVILQNNSGDEIKIWTDTGNHVDRFGLGDIDFEMLDATSLSYLQTGDIQFFLDDLTRQTAKIWSDLEQSPDDENRGQIYKMSYSLSTFNNESGRTTIPQLEIEINRGNGLTEFFNPYTDISPSDFTLSNHDLLMLDKLAFASIDMIDITEQVIPKQAVFCP